MSERGTLWALLFGNFIIGTGVMLVPGMLPLLAADLQVSIPTAGVLISSAAGVMCLGAPLMAGYTGAWDRRRLLSGSLLFYAVGHALCALMPGFAALLPLRAVTMLAAAVFTPQAAATLALLLPTERRAAGITFIFIGWSVASVAGMPLAAWLGAQLGWRATFGLFALASAAGAWWTWRAVPRGLRGTPLPLSAWQAVARSPVLLAVLAVTAVSSGGQFTVWAYIAPYIHERLAASAVLLSLLLVWFGLCGLAGNVLATRAAARRGPALTVHLANASMAVGLALLWLAGGTVTGFVLCSLLWGLGVFASNSSQQARLAQAAPALAGASIALNTSMIYLGQAVGTTLGGAVIAASSVLLLPPVAAGVLVGAVAASLWASRRAAQRA